MDCDRNIEILAAFAGGGMTPADADAMQQHVDQCPHCRHSLQSLADLDTKLKALPKYVPSPQQSQRMKQAILQAISPQDPQVLTLTEAANLLRLSLRQLEMILDELPAFEVAGELRVRRSQLLEWIQRREQLYGRSCLASQAARFLDESLGTSSGGQL